MKKVWLTLAILLLFPVTSAAQDRAVQRAFVWPEGQRVTAKRISDVIAVSSLTLPCLFDDRSTDCFKRQALRTGLTLGIAEVVKRTVKRERPDGSDHKSFFSGHTSLTCVSGLGSKRQLLGAALCAAAGYLRIAGNKHWFTDVLVGAGVGVGLSRIGR